MNVSLNISWGETESGGVDEAAYHADDELAEAIIFDRDVCGQFTLEAEDEERGGTCIECRDYLNNWIAELQP